MFKYHFDFSPGGAEAGCSACGEVFVNNTSFDVHRGIKPATKSRNPRNAPLKDDLRQDLGRCMTVTEMKAAGLRQDLPTGRWGDPNGLALVQKMRRMREQR